MRKGKSRISQIINKIITHLTQGGVIKYILKIHYIGMDRESHKKIYIVGHPLSNIYGIYISKSIIVIIYGKMLVN